MSFSAELWQAITPIYAAILDHPFVRGLTDGSLSREAFRFYAVQDALYLRDFARALSIAAARAPQDDWIIMFNEHAAGALKVERSLHESFFAEWGLTPEAVAATPLAPTNQAYTSYLLATAYGAPFHEAVAALLPCYWIYWEVGQALERLGSADPLYARWIGTAVRRLFIAAPMPDLMMPGSTPEERVAVAVRLRELQEQDEDQFLNEAAVQMFREMDQREAEDAHRKTR